MTKSHVSVGVQALLTLAGALALGSVAGVALWGAISTLVETAAQAPRVFWAALVGAAISAVLYGLFSILLGLLGPILAMAYQEWTAAIAPLIGGAVGAALGSGLAARAIAVVGLSAAAGGITLPLYRAIASRERVTLPGMRQAWIAGLGFGAINGGLLAAAIQLLKGTVGLSWWVRV